MTVCELTSYSKKPTGKGRNRIWPKCFKPAFYSWKSSQSNGLPVMVCRECGEMFAGNLKHELKTLE